MINSIIIDNLTFAEGILKFTLATSTSQDTLINSLPSIKNLLTSCFNQTTWNGFYMDISSLTSQIFQPNLYGECVKFLKPLFNPFDILEVINRRPNLYNNNLLSTMHNNQAILLLPLISLIMAIIRFISLMFEVLLRKLLKFLKYVKSLNYSGSLLLVLAVMFSLFTLSLGFNTSVLNWNFAMNNDIVIYSSVGSENWARISEIKTYDLLKAAQLDLVKTNNELKIALQNCPIPRSRWVSFFSALGLLAICWLIMCGVFALFLFIYFTILVFASHRVIDAMHKIMDVKGLFIDGEQFWYWVLNVVFIRFLRILFCASFAGCAGSLFLGGLWPS